MAVKQCTACLAMYNEVQFLREMIKNLMDKNLSLMSEALVPKLQEVHKMSSPIAINDNGKMVKMDEPDNPSPELQFTDAIDVINEVMGH